MLVEQWSIQSGSHLHGFRSPEEAREKFNNGNTPLISGLIFGHPTRELGINGITDGSMLSISFVSMPDSISIRSIDGEIIFLGEIDPMYERSFQWVRHRFYEQFKEEPCEDLEVIEPDPPALEELEQEERNCWKTDSRPSLSWKDDWNWYGYIYGDAIEE